MKKDNTAPVMEDQSYLLEEYEKLLIKRDQLERDAGSYQTAFNAEFGDILTENFELKIKCIRAKKEIAYCRRRINRGLPIDADKMKLEIDKEMRLYDLQLKEMISGVKNAKESDQVSDYELRLARKIYKKIVKAIHPDIYPKTMEDENLKDLWDRVVKAYHALDTKKLADLDVLVKKALENLGEKAFEVDLTDIEDRIERVERQINEILSTEPYSYGEVLNDEEKKKAFLQQLACERDDLAQYLESLTRTLDELLGQGGIKLTWQMN